MKNIKQTKAGGFYIFSGEVAANSNFIETINEAKRFLIYANYFLKDYVTIYDYNVTRHEWHMVVKLKSKEKIYSKSGLEYAENQLEDLVWRIVSDRVRLFLSTYVRCVNKARGRTGTLVHSSYERYAFTTLHEAKMVIEAVRKQTWRFYRRKRKYQGLKTHYMIPRKLGVGSIFLCSKELIRLGCEVRKIMDIKCLRSLGELVLLKLVKQTIIHHNPQPLHQNHPKLE